MCLTVYTDVYYTTLFEGVKYFSKIKKQTNQTTEQLHKCVLLEKLFNTSFRKILKTEDVNYLQYIRLDILFYMKWAYTE
jgi:hypothetical protein